MEKNRHFVYFKEHALLHLSKSFDQILDLSPPVNAPASFRSPICMYNVDIKNVPTPNLNIPQK